jgi:hypothetical protein
LLGLSTSTSRVSGRSASANARTSVWSTCVHATPKRGSTPCTSAAVPPYVLRCATTWSPARNSASAVVVTAPMPEANTTAASAPSRSASTAATWAWLGLPYRV